MLSSSKQSRGRAADDCARRLLEVLPSAMDLLRSAMRSHVGEQISVPQFRALNFVARPPGCTVGELAAFIGVTMPTASALADRLARAGWLQAQPDPQDRRRSRLQATAAGHGQLGQIARGARGELAARLAGCSAGELATLESGLEVLQRLSRSATTEAASGRAPRRRSSPPKASRASSPPPGTREQQLRRP